MKITTELDDFYKPFKENRDRFFGGDTGQDAVHWRNQMIAYLLERLQPGAVCLDLMAGDALVPLAILFLQKQDPSLRKVEKVYAVDNNHDGAFDLIMQNAGYFGLKDAIVPVMKDAEDRELAKYVPGVNVSTCIEGINHVTHPRGATVKDKKQFFKNLALPGQSHVLQVTGIVPVYTESFEKDFKETFASTEQGTLENIAGGRIIFMYGTNDSK